MRAFARRYGIIARPRSDRFSKRPTAMMGGVAIYLAVLLAYLFLVPHTREGWVVLGASSALFVVGLVDDFLNIKPYQKLIGQVLGASAVVYFGLLLPWGWGASVGMAVTIFWLIGITNAINLLDNMDGLAAGISAIAAVRCEAPSAILSVAICGEGQTRGHRFSEIAARMRLPFLNRCAIMYRGSSTS